MSSTGVEDETILEVLRSNDAPRMTTTEVAGSLPITRGRTRTRLQQLADEGKLERATAGNDVVWWLPERADELDETEEVEAGEFGEVGVDETGEVEAGETDAIEADETGEGGSAVGAGAESVESEPTAGAEPEAGSDGETDDGVEADVETGSAEEASDEATGEPATGTGEMAATTETTDDTGIGDLTPGDRTPEEGAATPTAAERAGQPELSPDDEGLRALAVLAVGLVVLLLLRRLLGGGE